MPKNYSMPTRVTFGDGTISALPSVPCIEAANNIALFIGGSSLKNSGKYDEIVACLRGKTVHLTENVAAQPSPKDLERETQKLRERMCDCIIAVGGGSVMDLAKSVGFCVSQQESVSDIFSALPSNPQRPVPTVALPTTAGTGSEVTPFAVFWDDDAKKKFSFAHSYLYPEQAVLDPELTHSMPPAVTAATGMDAFTQACEAYWNNNNNPVSDDYALLAVRRIAQWLPEAVQNGDNPEARREMALGSLQAGLAFSNTRTAACHSISYPMTIHFGVVHGQAVGITLPEVLQLNAQVQPDRVPAFCEALGSSSIEEAAQSVRKLIESAGLQTKLSALGIQREDMDILVKEGFTPNRMGNNPFSFDADSLRAMLERIF